MSQSKKTALPWMVVSALIIVFDQWSKYFVITHLTDTSIVHVLPFLNFILSFNQGAAFGFLHAESGWQIYFLSAISVLASLLLLVWLCRTPRFQWFHAMCISFVLGGAVGNLIDRIRLHMVIDFIDFHVKNWHYATFNVADSFVCMGAIGLIVSCGWRN